MKIAAILISICVAAPAALACPNMDHDKTETPRTADKDKDTKAKDADKAKDNSGDKAKPADKPKDTAKKPADAKPGDKVSSR